MSKKDKQNSMWWEKEAGFQVYPFDGGVEISEQYWQKLLDLQAHGCRIVGDENGYPVPVDSSPKTLEEHLKAKIRQIQTFDSGDAVNSFTINGVPMWLDKGTRTSLAASFDAEQRAGRGRTLLWTSTEPPVPVELPIDTARVLLNALEVYAKDAYNVTQQHIAAVHALDTIEAIKAYDHTAGYPDRLEF